MKMKYLTAGCRLVFFALVIVLLLGSTAWSASFYVSLGGSRTSGASTVGDWSSTNCYGDISSAIAKMSGGDEVIVNDGSYDYDEMDNSIGGMPSGTCVAGGGSYCQTGRYTTIKARNPFAVTIASNGDISQADDDRHVDIDNNYIHVDGFVFHHKDASDGATVNIGGDYNKVTRSISIRFGDAGNAPAGFSIGGNYNLVEDCAATGNTRYLFRTGGTSSYANHNIFRRCVARVDFATSEEPKAAFNVYGNNNTGLSAVNNIAFQNCIAVDGQDLYPLTPTDSSYKYNGDWYTIKGSDDLLISGSISLNNDSSGDTSVFFSGGAVNTTTVSNFVMWGASNELKTDGYEAFFSNITIGGSYRVQFAATNDIVENSAFFTNTNPAYSNPTTSSYNSFFGSYPASFGANQINETGLPLYLPRVDGSARSGAGSGGADVGANIIYKIGTSGTLHGETGWNTETSDSLWPWPYEYYIDREFSRANVPPSGAYPRTNDTTRGFTAPAYDHTDYPLTEYIWEYLGNEIGNTNAEIENFDFAAGYIPGSDGGGGSATIEPASNLEIQSQM